MWQINGDDDGDITEEIDKYIRNKISNFEGEYLQLGPQHMHFLCGKPLALQNH